MSGGPSGLLPRTRILSHQLPRWRASETNGQEKTVASIPACLSVAPKGGQPQISPGHRPGGFGRISPK